MKYKSEKTFVFLYIITILISTIQTLNQNKFPGELYRYYRTISDAEVLLLSFFNILSLVFLYFLFIILNKKRWVFGKRISYSFNYSKVDVILFIILCAQIVFLIKTGVGKVTIGEPATSKYSIIFSILKPDPFIYIYYLLSRNKRNVTFKGNKLFILNIAFFFLFKLMQGWSSFILVFFFLELSVYFNKHKNRSYLIYIIPIAVILFGGSVYKYVYVLKNEIRGINIETISVYEGIEKLSSRLTMNPNSLGAYQNAEKVIDLYKSEGITLKESKAFLRPIVPGSFINKDFRNLNNNVMQSYTPSLNKYTSSDFGIIMYMYILFKSSYLDFILNIILMTILVFMAKVFFDAFDSNDKILGFAFFYILFKLFYTCSLENVFAQNFIPYIYICFFLMIFGAIKKSRL